MKHITEFKVDMHHFYIRAWKDLAQTWTLLWFIVANDVVHKIVEAWPAAWQGPTTVEQNEATIQKKKEAAKHAA